MTDSLEMLKRLDPDEYFEQFLAEGIYPDGRELTKFRQTTIECAGTGAGHQGSAYVHQGWAYVSCSVQLSLAPEADDPLVQMEIEAMDTVPKDLLEHALAHLRVIFAEDRLLEPSQLRVSAESTAIGADGERKTVKRFDLRWTVHLKIAVLSWDGFMLDAILTAVEAALLDTSLPTRVEYADLGAAGTLFAEEEEEQFLLGEEVPLQFDIEKVRVIDPGRECVPLRLKQVLVYVPFLLYKSGKCAEEERIILADPPGELCKLLKDRCELLVWPDGRLHSCTFSLSNGGAMAQPLLDEMMAMAQRRHTAVSKALQKCAQKI